MANSDARELKVQAVLGEVDRVRVFLRDTLASLPVTEEEVLQIELALHEICVNIAMYAYPKGAPGALHVRIWSGDGAVFMEIRDRGVPFDPGRKPDPDFAEKLRRGQPGGLGVFLFKTLMDGFEYRREAGENVLTIFKKIPSGPASAQ